MFMIHTRRSAVVDPVDGHLKPSYLQLVQIAAFWKSQPENLLHSRSEPKTDTHRALRSLLGGKKALQIAFVCRIARNFSAVTAQEIPTGVVCR
jgi:hypothetical protein